MITEHVAQLRPFETPRRPVCSEAEEKFFMALYRGTHQYIPTCSIFLPQSGSVLQTSAIQKHSVDSYLVTEGELTGILAVPAASYEKVLHDNWNITVPADPAYDAVALRVLDPNPDLNDILIAIQPTNLQLFQEILASQQSDPNWFGSVVQELLAQYNIKFDLKQFIANAKSYWNQP